MKAKLRFMRASLHSFYVFRVLRGGIETQIGCVAKDPRRNVWANNHAVRVFKTRRAAAENLL